MKMCLLGINNSSIKDMLKKMLFAIVFILSLAINSFGSLKDDVLLVVHGREITRNEFLYHLRKNYQEVNQRNVEIFLDEFIILQLKLAQAIEEGIHHNIGFINELTEYRIILSSPYLTDNEKQQEFVNEALERLKYEIKIDQILVKYEANNNIDTLNAFRKAGEIRKRLLNGESFEEVAKLYLGDGVIIYKPNKDVFISAFETEYHIESAAFNLKKDEISMPVKSSNGYSIIQLSEKRESQKIQKTEQEVLNLIKDAKDERMQLIEDAFVTKLKKEWDFKENQEALNNICQFADERIYKGNWIPASNHGFEEVLFLIDGKSVLQSNFIEYMQNFETTDRSLTIKEYTHSLYTKFIAERLIQYENLKLPEKYPEFRFQYEEYRDAMLLMQITKQKVWLKAEDKIGIEQFFNENKTNYMAESENKNPAEIDNIVRTDYQNFLIKEWIAELRAKYRVKINKEILMSIKKQL
jgi:hypothetical protein